MEADTENRAAPEVGQAPMTNPADGIGAVLSNPELLAKLPQVMAMLRPMMEGAAAQQPSPPAPEGAGAPVSAKESATRPPTDNRTALLLALKPFLSEDRRNAVDAMLRISALGDVLRRL